MSDGVASRLEELAARYALPPQAPATLERLLELVATDPLAPTAIRHATRAVDEHIADALVALELQPVATARQIADLGSGAGFPGLVLAVSLPQANVFLVESNVRKCEFLDRTIRELCLDNARAVPERAESWQAGVHRCDLVTARALAPLSVIVEYAAPLLRPQGTLVAWKGHRNAAEEGDAAVAAAVMGLEPVSVHPVSPWSDARNRYLHLYIKVGSTPTNYPRRPGIARKRPHRAST